MINYVNNVVPMMTQPLTEFSTDKDVRFTKVKIWLMHLGENLNGSIFTKPVVSRAIPTLANTPIVGSATFSDEGEKDFGGHGVDVKVSEDGELKLVNTTIPFGVIPADNNAKFETRLCDDGIEREYLTCEGLLWNKWEDAVDIIVNKAGSTGQSMELASNYSGNFNEGVFEFTDFKFNGACLLGKDETPAMINSTVEMVFSTEAQEFIQNQIDLYNTYSLKNEEGGTTLKDNKVTTMFEDGLEDGTDIPVVDDEEKEPVDPEGGGSEGDGNGDDGEPPVEPDPEVPEPEPEEPEEEPKPEPELEPEVTAKENAGTVIEEDDEDLAKVRKQSREDIDNAPNPVEEIRVLDKLFTAKDIEEILAEKAKTEKELFTLKSEIHNEKANALFAEYDAHLTVEETDSLKAKVDNTSIEDLKTQIFSIIGMKSLGNYSAKPENKNTNLDTAPIFSAVGVSNETKTASKYSELFEKYLQK